jgi:hypothetical protein
MGLFDRFRGVGPEGYRAKAAERLELAGDLEGAVRSFLDAEMPDEAARVLLLRADAEVAVDKRMAFCLQAAKVAKDQKLAKKALARKAQLRYDLVRQKSGAMRSELLLVAKDLEEADENETAADAYAAAGDAEGEIRALTAAGLIDRLEEKLRESHATSRVDNELTLAQKQIADLDKVGERRNALALAKKFLSREPGARSDQIDDRIDMAARSIRSKLLRGPICELKSEGVVRRYALGDEVTVGRGEATIVVGTRALSRVHLKVYAKGGQVFVEDSGTRNGTFLAGARISAPIPVANGLVLKLGGDVPCGVKPVASGGVQIDVGGLAYFAPLGPLTIGAAKILLDGPGGDDESFVVVKSDLSAPLFLGEYQLGPSVELAVGDAPSKARGGAPLFLVMPGAGGP